MREKRAKEVFGWCMYDWANSAYVLTVVTALLPVWFESGVVPTGGARFFGLTFSAAGLWGFMISAAAAVMFLAAPVLGAIADFSGSKKRFMAAFCYVGAFSAMLLALAGPGDVWLAVVLFLIAQIGFVGANVFYDAFLPQIVDTERKGEMDRVSGRGFAYGYIGGALQFLIALGVVSQHEVLGLSQGDAVRACLVMAGLWWGGFALVTFRRLRERPPRGRLPAGSDSAADYVRYGFSRAWSVTRRLRTMPHVALFLAAFFFFNDGIQTTIGLATMYGRDELGLSATALMVTLLIIQFVAFGGALGFSRLAGRIGARPALLIALAIWTGIVVYAYLMTSLTEYVVLGIFVGLVLGGSQALARSLFASMIPAAESANFFGYYSVVSKLSAIAGPFIFGVLREATGSSRDAILPIALFFLVGMFLLWRVNPAESVGKRSATVD